MEILKVEVNNSCVKDKGNEIEKIVNKYLISGTPTIEPYLEIGGSIN